MKHTATICMAVQMWMTAKVDRRGRVLWRNDDGATAIEYGLIAALAALGLAGGFGLLSDSILSVFQMISDETASVNAGGGNAG